MFTICVVNESTSASLQKSQRILAKYLPQVGSKVYLGSISKEGLTALEDELIAIRSRYMSIVAYHVKNNHRTSVAFSVGNVSHFDLETGLYAFREKTIPLALPSTQKSTYFKVIQSITRLAALFHDIAKSSDAFQAKLNYYIESPTQKGKKPQKTAPPSREMFRHDMMSFFLLHMLLASASPSLKLENATTLLAITPTQLKELQDNLKTTPLSTQFLSTLSTLKEQYPSAKDLPSFKDAVGNTTSQLFKCLRDALSDKATTTTGTACAVLSILVLVLTHHKLVELADNNTADAKVNGISDTYNKSFEKFSQQFANLELFDTKTAQDSKNYQAFLQLLTYSKGTAFHDTQYLDSVFNELNTLTELLPKLEAVNPAQFFSAVMHFARPILIISDHLGSIQKIDAKPSRGRYPDYKEVAIANTVRGSKEGLFEAGDTVVTHLRSVSNFTRKVSGLANAAIHDKTNGDLFPRVALRMIPKLSEMLLPSGNDKFYWQQEAFDTISKLPTSQKFVSVIAETGAGKTIASAKILAALSPQTHMSLRYVYALGLRSLTLQTGKSYQEDIGLSDAQLAILLGDAIQKKLAMAETVQDAQPYQPGSESYDLFEDFDSVVSSVKQEGEWLEYLDNSKSEYRVSAEMKGNMLKLIDAPIVVCTIDQLIDVTYLHKLAKARLFLRLFNSDLVLDEVDNYSTDQLQAIARLVYLTAMFGNSVVCMSATMSPYITQALSNAFNAGRLQYNLLSGKNTPAHLVQVSNIIDTQVVELPASTSFTLADSPDTAETLEALVPTNGSQVSWKHIIDYNDKVSDRLAEREAKSTVSTLPFQTYDSQKELFDSYLATLTTLHEQFSTDVEGGKVSAGFIKFNTVKNARKFSRYLVEESLNLPADTELSMVCYHSKYSTFELQQIDQLLNTLVNRKRLPASENFSEAAKAIIRRVQHASGKKNIMLLVVTTSILETGRDHDYDYCLCEPASTRSLIQAAGRVYRHRPSTHTRNNVVQMASTVRYQIAKSNKDTTPVKQRAGLVETPPLAQHVNMLGALPELCKKSTYAEELKPLLAQLSSKDTNQVFGKLGNEAMSSRIALTLLRRLPESTTYGSARSDYPATLLEQLALKSTMLGYAEDPRMNPMFKQLAVNDYFRATLVFTKFAYRTPFRSKSQTFNVSILENSTTLKFNTFQLSQPDVPLADQNNDFDKLAIEELNPLHLHRLLILNRYFEAKSWEHAAKALRDDTAKELRRILSEDEICKMCQYQLTLWTSQDEQDVLGYYHPLVGFDTNFCTYE